MSPTMKLKPFKKKYVPNSLTPRDKRRQLSMLRNSRNFYKKGKFHTRKKLDSFTSKKSNHVLNALRMYRLNHIVPNEEMVKATGCPKKVLEGIVKKGEGAYYSSGSRPNQTAQSWAYARLASAVTGGPASIVDYHLVSQCNPKKKAFQLANKARAS
jgi:hypothetical protein